MCVACGVGVQGAESVKFFATRPSASPRRKMVHPSNPRPPLDFRPRRSPVCIELTSQIGQQQKGNRTKREAIKDRALGERGPPLCRMEQVYGCGRRGSKRRVSRRDFYCTTRLGDVVCSGLGIVIGAVGRSWRPCLQCRWCFYACGAYSFGLPGNGTARLVPCDTAP